MTISYRRGRLEDAAAIDGVFRKSFCDTFEHLYRPQDLDAFLREFTLVAWEAELKDDRFAFQVAEAEGQVVGYVKLGPPALPVETEGASVELRQLYLLKEWHGLGAAKSLMDWAIEEAKARGGTELYLTVYIENERARRLYERYGFVEVGPYHFMVGEQADEDIIMKLAL
jgi:ribosomal protein S18 acetylase RimI-like enzyme